MSQRDARARVEALLAGLEISAPFDVEQFCLDVAARRGRRIHLKAVNTDAVDLPSGVVYEMSAADVILYDSTTSPYHQKAIILHEIGHLIAGHKPGGLVSDDAAEVLLPEIGHFQARRLASRESYTSREEHEAEYFARRVLEIVNRQTGPTPEGRVEDTFEG